MPNISIPRLIAIGAIILIVIVVLNAAGVAVPAWVVTVLWIAAGAVFLIVIFNLLMGFARRNE